MEHIFRVQDYQNLLNCIKLTSEQIVKEVSSYKLTFLKVRNDFIEWGTKLPMFVPAFYEYIMQKEHIPNQDSFYSYYLEVNAKFFETSNFNHEAYEGLKARIFRTYPSLVRDICFNKYVSENLQGYNVIYNIDLDINEGIDLLIYNNATFYAVSLFINTQRAAYGRKVKEHRHKLFSNVRYIDFPVALEESHKCGDFFLYGEEEFRNLLNVLK